jgi:hypothetical protein
MNSLGKRSVSITEIDWEPCENMLRTSKSQKIFSNTKRGKSWLVTSWYKTSITMLFCVVIYCYHPQASCRALIHHLLLTVWHTSSMLPCPYPPSNKVQTTNLMLGYHLLMVTWYFISQCTNQMMLWVFSCQKWGKKTRKNFVRFIDVIFIRDIRKVRKIEHQ